MKLTDNERAVFEYVKANGTVSIPEIASALGKTTRQVMPNITAMVKGKKQGLLSREDRTGEGSEKPVGYISVTPEGQSFVESDE